MCNHVQSHAKSAEWLHLTGYWKITSPYALRASCQARIAGALGGRVAEQLVFGASQVTTGAGGDLQQVERMARAMVTQFGMSEAGTGAENTVDLCNIVW